MFIFPISFSLHLGWIRECGPRERTLPHSPFYILPKIAQTRQINVFKCFTFLLLSQDYRNKDLQWYFSLHVLLWFCLLWCIHMYMKNQQSWPEPNKFCCEQHFPRSITLSNLDFLVCCICLHSTFTYLTIGLLGSSINLFCIVCILHEKSTVLSWSK